RPCAAPRARYVGRVSASWRRLAEVDPDRLGLGVVGHRLQALVAAEARLLVAAPGLGHVTLVEAIDPDHARLAVAAGADRGMQVPRPDAGGEAVDRIVGDLDRLVDAAEGNDGADRPEDLLARDPHPVVDADEQRRLDIAALLQAGRHLAALDDL